MDKFAVEGLRRFIEKQDAKMDAIKVRPVS